MPSPLHIIASCTERKRLPIPDALRLRGVKARTLEERAHLWWKRLEEHPQAPLPALNLYAGDHWRIVQELPEVAARAGFLPRLWVASAGYGLVPSDAPVRPYSATFAPGKPDSVEGEPWWRALAHEAGASRRGPRQLHQVAERHREAFLLVIASPSYVAALQEDLCRAARALRRPEQLLIISAPCPVLRGPLGAHWVPSSAHLQARLGGALLSLHARVARDALRRARDGILDVREIRGYYEQLIHRSAPPVRHGRTPMTDDGVRDFIARALHPGPRSCSATLRLLRDSGHACEQHRFKRLFFEFQERT